MTFFQFCGPASERHRPANRVAKGQQGHENRVLGLNALEILADSRSAASAQLCAYDTCVPRCVSPACSLGSSRHRHLTLRAP